MLAVAGIHQVAVIVLPRPSYHKLVNSRVDCKLVLNVSRSFYLLININRSIQVGQYYHAVSASSRVTKVDWHPWSEGGSSLLVLTADSMFRCAPNTLA
jgi:nucleoporin NUP82